MKTLYYIKQQPHSLITFHCPKNLAEVKVEDYAYVWYGFVEEDIENASNYDEVVWLESLFQKFNIDHPKHFAGHSLSVGDIVTFCDYDEERGRYNSRSYICDSFGWKRLPEKV